MKIRSGLPAALLAVLLPVLLSLSCLSACAGRGAGAGTDGPGQQEVPAVGKGHKEPRIPVPVIPEITAELPTGILVMIDNFGQARPQSGIDKADVVYEMIAEGGITRYMALFYSEAAPVIGPVRSARYYFVQLAKGMDLPFAHVGGADDALAMVGGLKVKDINEISNAQKYFWQDPKRKRPHATYTGTEQLMEAIVNKQYAFKVPDLPPVEAEFSGEALTDGQVTLTYATGRNGYQAQWIWEEDLGEGGRYRRYINGEAQTTADGVPVAADTVFVVAALSKARNTDPVTSSVEIVGGGEALRIADNTVLRGSWEKTSAESPLVMTDGNGGVMGRKAGKTWIQVVDSMENVRFGR